MHSNLHCMQQVEMQSWMKVVERASTSTRTRHYIARLTVENVWCIFVTNAATAPERQPPPASPVNDTLQSTTGMPARVTLICSTQSQWEQ